MPVISMRRPGTSLLCARLARRRAGAPRPARARSAGGGQLLFDRIEPPADRAQLGAQLAQVVGGDRPALVDGLLDALTYGPGSRLGPAPALGDRLLGATSS